MVISGTNEKVWGQFKANLKIRRAFNINNLKQSLIRSIHLHDLRARVLKSCTYCCRSRAST